MANEEHVKQLLQRAGGWDWAGVDLSKADLGLANLSSISLAGANLSNAHLEHADLSETNLTGANLSSADLSGANLSEANLSGANLTDAHMAGTNLVLAILADTNLTGVTLSYTIFGDVNLAKVVGLETCRHFGPSTIDYGTLQRSGPLPLEFLRGVGLPDQFIEYLPSLLGQAIEYYSCFISYSSKDEELAKRINADLQNNGVRCWFAPHDMPTGGNILDEIHTAIRGRDKVLLILSKHSIKSDWVEDEVSKAFAEERKRKQPVLFPVRLDDAVMKARKPWAAKLRDQRHIGDFRGWKDHDGYKRSFERVLTDLKRVAE